MQAAVRAALGHTLPAAVTSRFDPAAFAAQWAAAITAPQTADIHVLCAVAAGRIVGFTAVAPTARVPDDCTSSGNGATRDHADADDRHSREASGVSGRVRTAPTDGNHPTGKPPASRMVYEFTALEVAESDQRQGHGSRLLAAATDIARSRGATEVQLWVLAGDDAHTSFLASAGFAPSGLRRRLDIAGEIATQHCWRAEL
ncbi:GNAT family N-acetyltransferase [Actinobaculum sp. 352]|nr:hypothetical protein DDD63_07565 [Actinobaculum sp. 313]RTE47966.1 GNAT family N-acetyltransferase [Actinobaculum sp. 352]